MLPICSYIFENKKPNVTLAVAVALAAFALQGCNSTSANVDPATTATDAPKGKGGRGGRGREGGAVPVITTSVKSKTVPIEISAVGNVEAYSTINVVSQIGGQLTRAYFQEGDFVRKGDKQIGRAHV